MAASKTSDNSIRVPGIATTAAIPRSTVLAVFVPGFDAYALQTSPTIDVRGTAGDPVKARVIGAEVGRLYSLATRFMAQAPAVIAATVQPGGYNFQDVAFFNALSEVVGDSGLSPLSPYTVLMVTIDPDVPMS